MEQPIAATDKQLEDINRYERLLTLYAGLIKELDSIHKEGKLLRKEVQSVIDKEQMHHILKKIQQQES